MAAGRTRSASVGTRALLGYLVHSGQPKHLGGVGGERVKGEDVNTVLMYEI